MPKTRVVNGETWVLDDKSGKWYKKVQPKGGLKGGGRRSVATEFNIKTKSKEEKELEKMIKHKKKVGEKFRY